MKTELSDLKRKAKALAGKLADEHDADILIFNFGIEPGFDFHFARFLEQRSFKKKNVFMFLSTEGGDADAAYRIARYMQDRYKSGKFTVIVAGWCKSAGTLICTGAHELLICDTGELGPLDVQIAKADELGERSSGLAIEAAFEKLQEESFKLFLRNINNINDEIGGRITFKTAAEMSSNMVIGLMGGIFSKVDPLAVGEDYRSNLIAEDYAMRLNLIGRNLKSSEALKMLVRGYPSHRFVIDRAEAENLFKCVLSPTGEVAELANLLDEQVVIPRNHARNQTPHLEFLNDEPAKQTQPKTTDPIKATAARAARAAAKPGNGAATPDISGGISARAEQERRKPTPARAPSRN